MKNNTEQYYNENIYPSKDCPRCIVTNLKLAYKSKKELGCYYSSSVKNVFFNNDKDIKKAKGVIDRDYIYIEEMNGFYADFRSVSRAITKLGLNESLRIVLYNKYFQPKSKCVLENCNEKISYEMIRYVSCCINHYNKNKDIKKGKRKKEDFNNICLECQESFANTAHLTIHIEKNHMTVEEYYNKHISSIKGECKWCKIPTKFRSINSGYDSFCYNTACNINYHNTHENRHQCGDKISKSIIKNKNSPNQKEFWMKKGMDEENAINMVSKRQTTNSVDAIMKRKKCTRVEATDIRKEITEKWLKSFPNLNYSMISQELFWSIYEKIKENYKEVYFATLNNGLLDESGKNHEYRVKTEKTYRQLDFYVKDINKAIEFLGEYWHSEKNKRYNFTLGQDIKREKEIIDAIGCKILNIKELDYTKNKEKTIQQCLDFILNDN